jgi:hypothetical protein
MSSITGPGADGSGDVSRRALRILARSLVRELKSRGYGLRHIVLLAGDLIDLASEWVRSNHSRTAPARHQRKNQEPGA